MISRQDASRRLEQMKTNMLAGYMTALAHGGKTDADHEMNIEAVECAINVLETADKHAWKPYPEHKPNDEQNCICWIKENDIVPGHTAILGYCEGWNCYRDSWGVIHRESEICHIVAWREIEPFEE